MTNSLNLTNDELSSDFCRARDAGFAVGPGKCVLCLSTRLSCLLMEFRDEFGAGEVCRVGIYVCFNCINGLAAKTNRCTIGTFDCPKCGVANHYAAPSCAQCGAMLEWQLSAVSDANDGRRLGIDL